MLDSATGSKGREENLKYTCQGRLSVCSCEIMILYSSSSFTLNRSPFVRAFGEVDQQIHWSLEISKPSKKFSNPISRKQSPRNFRYLPRFDVEIINMAKVSSALDARGGGVFDPSYTTVRKSYFIKRINLPIGNRVMRGGFSS